MLGENILPPASPGAPAVAADRENRRPVRDFRRQPLNLRPVTELSRIGCRTIWNDFRNAFHAVDRLTFRYPAPEQGLLPQQPVHRKA